MNKRLVLAGVIALSLVSAAPIAASPGTSVCWNDGSGTIVTCAHGGSWDANPQASGVGQCYHIIAWYDLGSGPQTTGWRSAGAAVEADGQVLHVC